MKRYTLAAVAALLVLIPWHKTVRADAPLYSVQDLGSFNGLVPTISGVNAAGQVAGNVNGNRAVRYTPGHGWEAVPGLGTSYSFATGINASGDVVGYYLNSASQFRAFRYRDGIGVDDIAPVGDGSMTFGYAINDAGEVAGVSYGSTSLPFRAAIGLATEALPTLGGGAGSACGINGNGQVAGTSTIASGPQHGIRVDNGASAAIDIASLDGPSYNVNACAIDAVGSVGGQFARASGQTHAFLFDGATAVDVDTFGSGYSNIEAINGGVSVGWYTVASNQTRAFAHRSADGSFDLNTRIDAAGWVLQTAKAVNGNGQIAGEGTFNGANAVFLLTPSASDTTPPAIDAHADETAEATGANGATVIYTAPATSDAVDGPGTAACTPVSGSTFALGTTTVTCTASDAAGNAATPTTFKVVVRDTTAPLIAAHGDVAAEATGANGATVSYTAPATTDTVDGNGTAVCAPASGSTFALGTATVSCSASDAAGNAATPTTFKVVVSDTTAPTIAAHADVTAEATSARGATVSYVAPATSDAVDGNGTAACAPSSGSTFALGTTTVTCGATDAAGNAAASVTFKVVVSDTTPPAVTSLAAAPTWIWPANGKMVAVSVAAAATDAVDASPVCTLTSVTGGSPSDVVLTGPLSASVRATRNADGSVRTYLFNVSCTDGAKNASQAAVSVGVGKNIPQQVYRYSRRLHAWLSGLGFGRWR